MNMPPLTAGPLQVPNSGRFAAGRLPLLRNLTATYGALHFETVFFLGARIEGISSKAFPGFLQAMFIPLTQESQSC